MLDTVNIYWAPLFNNSHKDWSFLYQKPQTLFNDLGNDVIKDKGENALFFSCPAISNKFTKTYVFKSSMDSSYKYNEQAIEPTTRSWIHAEYVRTPTLKAGPLINFNLDYIFFAEEPVDAYFTPPFFHKPQYTNYGSVIPGEFDIGKWFRPYTFEVQTWSTSGEFHIKKDEPLFYVEFKTNKKINLQMFSVNDQIIKYTDACVNATTLLGLPRSSLIDRYKLFKNIGMREKILLEIRKNILYEQ